MNKRKYTIVLYIEIEQYVAFVRTLRRCPDYEFVGIKMCYDRCHDGIYRHLGYLRVTMRFRSVTGNHGLEMFFFGMKFQQELDDIKLINY